MNAVVDKTRKVIAVGLSFDEAKAIADQHPLARVIQICKGQNFGLGQVVAQNIVKMQVKYDNNGSIIF